MQTNQIFNKHVLLNHTYDYVGILYKLIISANSGEILHVLIESQQFGQMFVLPFDKIISIAEEYLIIESRQALADFESFKGIADGKFLIVDEETVRHLKIEGVIESQIASKSGAPKQSSYFTIMQYDKPEIKKEPVGVVSGVAKSAMYDPQTKYYQMDEGPILTEPHHDEYVKSETQRIWNDEPVRDQTPPIEFTRSGGNSEARHYTQEAMPVSGRQFLHPQNIFQREEKLRLAKEAISSSQENQSIEFISKSNELNKIKVDIEREKESLQKLNVQHQIVTRELDQIRYELESVEQEKEESLKSISSGNAELNELMLQKKSLFKEIDIARAELDRVHGEISDQNDKLSQLHKEMEEAEQNKANLEHSLQTALKEIEEAEQNKANLEHSLQETQKEMEETEQNKANLEYSLQIAQKEMEETEQSKANLEYSLQTAQREMEEVEQSKANLEYSVQTAQEGYNDITELFMLQEKRLKQTSLNQTEQQNAAPGMNNAGVGGAWGNGTHGNGTGGVSAPAANGSSENWNQSIAAGGFHEPIATAYPGGPSENMGYGQTFEVGVTHEPAAAAYPGGSTPNLQIGETGEPRTAGPMPGSLGETAGVGAQANYVSPVATMQPETVVYSGPVDHASPQVSEQKNEADLIQDYIDKQREGLIGKTLSRNVSDREGNVLLSAGTVISAQLFDEVITKYKDAVVELAMFAE